MSDLVTRMEPRPEEEECPYEALFEATSCHSLDSLASGKSSDRDSGRPESEPPGGKVLNLFGIVSVLHVHPTHLISVTSCNKPEVFDRAETRVRFKGLGGHV